VWNTPLPANAPLATDSDRLASALSQEVWLEAMGYTGAMGPWINFDHYSTPVYRVGSNTPTVRVTLDTDYPSLQTDFAAVPIPAGARQADGTDGSLTVYQRSTDTLWEFWLARRDADGWHARWGGKMTHVSTNRGYFPNPLGATATSLPLLGGLMTIDELQAGKVDHALALGIPNTDANTVTWPAQRGDGRRTGATAIPEGTHFRIDPSVDLSQLGLSKTGLAIAKAVQRYGMVVRDTSGCVAFYAEDPLTRTDDPYSRIFGGAYPNQVLSGFPWDRLQVVAPSGG
jgi:hypothetical protein